METLSKQLIYSDHPSHMDMQGYKDNYQEWLKDSCQDETQESLEDYIDASLECDWTDAVDTLRNTRGIFLVKGTVNRWNGVHTVITVPEDCDDLENVIQYLQESVSRSQFYTTLYYVQPSEETKGFLEIHLCHHDGTNTFQIYKLPDDYEIQKPNLETLEIQPLVIPEYEMLSSPVIDEEPSI